jgi:hypothetical protein
MVERRKESFRSKDHRERAELEERWFDKRDMGVELGREVEEQVSSRRDTSDRRYDDKL